MRSSAIAGEGTADMLGEGGTNPESCAKVGSSSSEVPVSLTAEEDTAHDASVLLQLLLLEDTHLATCPLPKS